MKCGVSGVCRNTCFAQFASKHAIGISFFKPMVDYFFRTPEERPQPTSGQAGKEMHLGLLGSLCERATFGIPREVGCYLHCLSASLGPRFGDKVREGHSFGFPRPTFLKETDPYQVRGMWTGW